MMKLSLMCLRSLEDVKIMAGLDSEEILFPPQNPESWHARCICQDLQCFKWIIKFLRSKSHNFQDQTGTWGWPQPNPMDQARGSTVSDPRVNPNPIPVIGLRVAMGPKAGLGWCLQSADCQHSPWTTLCSVWDLELSQDNASNQLAVSIGSPT